MRTIAYVHVLRGSADACGLEADNIPTDDFDVLRRAHSRGLANAYEFEKWPDLVRLEKRYFRNLFTPGSTLTAATTVAVSEVFFPQTTKYYQALRDMPLTVSSITRSGSVATVTTAASHLLVTGNQMAISGATQTDYNITATITVTGAATFTYTVANAPTTPATGTIRCTPTPTNSSDAVQNVYWAESLSGYSGDEWLSTETNTLGDVRYWPGTDRYYIYYNSTDSAGNQPTNTTYWRVLTDFDRYVAWAQTGQTDLNGASILEVWSLNPRTTARGGEVPYELSSNGIQVLRGLPYAWVEYRQKPPQLKGDAFSAATTYASGNQAYYVSTTAEGNFYDANQATTAGDTPESAPTKWDVVSIPYIFERYLVQYGYGQWLRHDGQDDKAAIEERKAEELLSDQSMQLVGVQQQRRRTQVRTR